MANPNNPSRPITGSWDDVTSAQLQNAFVASASTSGSSDAARSQARGSKSLYLGDPTADVRVGDRIRYGDSVGYVNALPESDTNPFSGWQPVKEIPLEEVQG